MEGEMATVLNREATIRTAIVEIRILSVSGKQVTQALFRQIDERFLVDPDTLELQGQPWGRVNYHFGCNAEEWGDHLHVVWQEDNELRRDCIYADKSVYGRTTAEEQARWALLYRELEALDQLFISV
jgi:hypothetical protein